MEIIENLPSSVGLETEKISKDTISVVEISDYLNALTKFLKDLRIAARLEGNPQLKKLLEDLAAAKGYKYTISEIQDTLKMDENYFMLDPEILDCSKNFLESIDSMSIFKLANSLSILTKVASSRFVRLKKKLKKKEIIESLLEFLDSLKILLGLLSIRLGPYNIIKLSKARYAGIVNDSNGKKYLVDLLLLRKDSSLGLIFSATSFTRGSADLLALYLGAIPSALYLSRLLEKIKLSLNDDANLQLKLDDEGLRIMLDDFVIKIAPLENDLAQFKDYMRKLEKALQQPQDSRIKSFYLRIPIKVSIYKHNFHGIMQDAVIELDITRLKGIYLLEDLWKKGLENLYRQLELSTLLKVETFIMRNKMM
jgi:hypothetical protein